jgi:hypothetical protein
VSHDEVLFGYRLRLFTLAEEIGVRPACRGMGIHHLNYVNYDRAHTGRLTKGRVPIVFGARKTRTVR